MDKKIIFLIAGLVLVIFTSAFVSDLSLGDEAWHYGFARNIYRSGRITTLDPVYEGAKIQGPVYRMEPLWHILLALVWRIGGGMSFPLAQFYHVLYFALLVMFTYMLAKRLYGEEEGFYSAVIVSSVPMVVVFSVLFYQDVPIAMLGVLCVLLVVNKRFPLAGLVAGVSYFIKPTISFFIPALLFLVLYYSEGDQRVKIKSVILFLMPAAVLIGAGAFREYGSVSIITSFISGKIAEHGKDTGLSRYYNSWLGNPVDILKYFGIIVLACPAAYMIRKKYEKKDIVIWLPVVSYFVLSIFAFTCISRPSLDVRYLLPITPFLAVISARALTGFLRRKWIRIMCVGICLLQFAGAFFYVVSKRQVPSAVEEGFVFIRKNTPPSAIIIYPECVFLEETDRGFIWSYGLKEQLAQLFWGEDRKEVIDFLVSKDIRYLAVKKTRVYDDSEKHHLGGYPASFVNRMHEMPFFELVFDNNEISVWRISGGEGEDG